MYTVIENIRLVGLVVELSPSQSQNFMLIQSLWKSLNEDIKTYDLRQDEGEWIKYGLTYKLEDRYYYLAAIPHRDRSFPKHFVERQIYKGRYKLFVHKGELKEIANTIFRIYKKLLPALGLIIEKSNESGLMHFEKYDYRFSWNNPNSIIDIYLPLETSAR